MDDLLAVIRSFAVTAHICRHRGAAQSYLELSKRRPLVVSVSTRLDEEKPSQGLFVFVFTTPPSPLPSPDTTEKHKLSAKANEVGGIVTWGLTRCFCYN